MLHVISGLALVFFCGCGSDTVGNDPTDAVSDANDGSEGTDGVATTDGGMTGVSDAPDSGADECREAIERYRRLFDSFDRSCVHADDCTWFDDLEEFGCDHFGNVDADPSPIYDAKAEIESTCTLREQTEHGYADNNFACFYQKDGSPGGTLYCEGDTCAVR